MASVFSIRQLSVLAYAHGFTLWHYRLEGPTPVTDVRAQRFFDDAIGMLAVGDMVMVSSQLGGTILMVTSTLREVTVTPLS
jgi:hypothetical protein